MRQAIIVLSCCVLASVGRASVVYVDIPDVNLTASAAAQGSLSTSIDVNGDGVNDLSFSVNWNRATPSFRTDVGTLNGAGTLQRNGIGGGWPWPMPSATAIGATAPPTSFWSGGGVLQSTGELNYGFWTGGAGLLGVRIPVAGGTVYSWVEVYAASSFVSVTRYAYESEVGQPIAAGAVPSPGALGLVAAGGVLAARLRRR